MGQYSQEDRVFRVAVPSLGEDVLLLEGFSGHEHVSEPFEFTLEMVSENDSIDPEEVLRGPILLWMRLPDGTDRPIHGRCSRFAQLGRHEELTHYEAEVVPWLWFLSLTQDCKIFQDMTVLEIIEEVFSKYEAADYENNCIEDYSPREYCVQYRETDLNFVSRLMEEEGIFYFFEHSEDGHKLILADDSSALEDCPGQSTFSITTTPDAWVEEDVITEFEREYQVYTNRVTLTDFDHLQPSMNLQSTASDDDHEELYDYPGRYSELSAGERYAGILLEERAAGWAMARGAGTCRAQASGYKFDLTDHYRSDANQTYFLLSVWHVGRGGGYRSGDSDTEYTNQFECIPANVAYRPPRVARKPLMRGTQTAVVVGPSGEEIHTETHGRVKVQFHWDRIGQLDENSSCWIRVSHPWAGKGWGAVSIPRIGQEVIVDFLEGDPDRPIITGRVYNAESMPPFGLPDGAVVSGIKSDSHKGSGFNAITMDDTAGKEQLKIHGQYDMITEVQHDRSTTIKSGNDTISVEAGTRSVTVKGDTSLTVQAGSRTVSVTGGDYSSTASGAVKLHGKGAGVKITGDASGVTITGTPNVDISGASTAKVSSPSVDIGDAKITIHGSIVKIDGSTITISAKGGSVTVDASGVSISGSAIKSAASGVNEIKGSMVKLN